MLMAIYLSGCVLVTVGAFAAGKHYNDQHNPAPHLFWVSVIAGALWPLLMVGLVELSSVVMASKGQSRPAPRAGLYV